MTVNVNGGGVVDCGDNAIKINAHLNGTGGLLFTGGNRIDIGNVGINYANATAVTPGTTLAVGQYGAMNNILSSERGLVVEGRNVACPQCSPQGRKGHLPCACGSAVKCRN